MKKQEQIKKNILQVMACGGEVEVKVLRPGFRNDGNILSVELEESNPLCNTTVSIKNLLKNLDRGKPIFHRIDSLTKGITVEGYNDGKAFVPIVELAKSGENQWFEDNDLDISAYDENGNCGCGWLNSELDIKFAFAYFTDHNCFYLKSEDDRELIINHMGGLYDQLHQWGFFTGDQSLFDSGDIIDKLKID